MRVLIISFFVVIICHGGAAQNRIIDSLEAVVNKYSKEDTVQVTLLNELSFRVFKSRPDQSYDYARKALTMAERLKFSRGIGKAKNNFAIYHLMKGEVDLALKETFEALKIGEQNRLEELLADSYANLGIIYNNQAEYDKAGTYLALAKNVNLKLNNTLIGSKIFNTYGLMLVNLKKYDSALFYFKKALKVMEDGKEIYRVPEVINNIGLVYTRQNKNTEALSYYHKALEVAEKYSNHRAEALALFNIGNTVLSQKKYIEAERILLQSLALALKTGETKIIGANYMALGQLKNETGKFEEAHSYISRFYEMKDSLLDIEKMKKVAELEVRYETEKKEHVIELLERDNKIQRLWANMLITVLVFAGVLFIAIYYLREYHEQKNRQILNLEIDNLTSQNKELSEKFKNVLTGSNLDAGESVDQRLLKKAISVIESKLSDSLFGVEQMAKELGMSRTSMHRKIKAITGFPPSELIRNIRLRRAAALLMNQSDSIAQISFMVGFEDHSYFSKSFKKQFGVSPSEYFESMQHMEN